MFFGGQTEPRGEILHGRIDLPRGKFPEEPLSMVQRPFVSPREKLHDR
jgi:hypothetical protein